MITTLMVAYRTVHKAMCLYDDFCYPCDAPDLKFYAPGLVADTVAVTLGIMEIVRRLG